MSRPFRPPGALLAAQFAMLVMPSSIPPVPAGDGDAVPGADLAERVLSGPGLWLDWLARVSNDLEVGSLFLLVRPPLAACAGV